MITADMPDLSDNPDLMIAEAPGEAVLAAFSDAAKDCIALLLERGMALSCRDHYTQETWEDRRYASRFWEAQARGDQIQACLRIIHQRQLRITTTRLHREP